MRRSVIALSFVVGGPVDGANYLALGVELPVGLRCRPLIIAAGGGCKGCLAAG